MVRNRDEESEDEQWLNEIRHTPAQTDFGSGSAQLAPDPWLDSPQPGEPIASEAPPDGSPEAPANPPAADDPWATSSAPTGGGSDYGQQPPDPWTVAQSPEADASQPSSEAPDPWASASPPPPPAAMPTVGPPTGPAPAQMPVAQPSTGSAPAPMPTATHSPGGPASPATGAVPTGSVEPPDPFAAAPDPFGAPTDGPTGSSTGDLQTGAQPLPTPPTSSQHAGPSTDEQPLRYPDGPATGAHSPATGAQPPATGGQPAAFGHPSAAQAPQHVTAPQSAHQDGYQQGQPPQWSSAHETAQHSPAQQGSLQQGPPQQWAVPRDAQQQGAPHTQQWSPQPDHTQQQWAPQQDAAAHGGYPAAPQNAQYGAQPTPQAPTAPPEINHQSLVRENRAAPQSGWRRAVFKASFGGINPGISKEEQERTDLVSRIRTPIRGCHKIAVVSLKGGIGKTTTTSCLGLTLAHYRGDRVVALDANPDAGTLAERLTGVTDVSVRNLLDDIDNVHSFTDISRYMSLASRLQVLASDQDAEVSEAFDAQQYTDVTDLLARYYNVILTDSGTGMLHSAMQGTLESANSLVVVGAPSVDGSSRASKTLDWLIAHGYGDLVSNSVAVISSVRQKAETVDMEVLRNHFGARCRTVIEIPYDAHLVVGGKIDMEQISAATNKAYLQLAAAVADGFTNPVPAARDRAS